MCFFALYRWAFYDDNENDNDGGGDDDGVVRAMGSNWCERLSNWVRTMIRYWICCRSIVLDVTLFLSLFECRLCDRECGICLWSDIYGFYCWLMLVTGDRCRRLCIRFSLIDSIELIANGIGYNVNKNQMYLRCACGASLFRIHSDVTLSCLPSLLW